MRSNLIKKGLKGDVMEEVLLSIVEALDLINAGILLGIGISWGIVLGWVAADLGSKLVDKAIIFLRSVFNER